jgi:hypothetical protein
MALLRVVLSKHFDKSSVRAEALTRDMLTERGRDGKKRGFWERLSLLNFGCNADIFGSS